MGVSRKLPARRWGELLYQGGGLDRHYSVNNLNSKVIKITLRAVHSVVIELMTRQFMLMDKLTIVVMVSLMNFCQTVVLLMLRC